MTPAESAGAVRELFGSAVALMWHGLRAGAGGDVRADGRRTAGVSEPLWMPTSRGATGARRGVRRRSRSLGALAYGMDASG